MNKDKFKKNVKPIDDNKEISIINNYCNTKVKNLIMVNDLTRYNKK